MPDDAEPSLTQQLSTLRDFAASRIPAPMFATMTAANADLAASDLVAKALKAGDFAPDFTLPGVDGRDVRLQDRLADHAVILIFYRGGWCPYCNFELRAYQSQLPAIAAAGAQLIAISPQTPDNSLSTVEKNDLTFTVLSDAGSKAAQAFGVAFELPEALKDIYQGFGNDLPTVNGDGRWMLPIPAVYAIARSGKIIFAHLDTDYQHRLEPAVVIAAARAEGGGY